MKLLAAGPPLLFLALYSLSFIDLSFSAPENLKLDLTYYSEEAEIISVDLKEPYLIAAGYFLKKSTLLRDRLVDVSILYWSMLSQYSWMFPDDIPPWLNNVEDFKQALIDYSLQAVKADLPADFKNMATSVEHEEGYKITVKLTLGKEEMELVYPCADVQLCGPKYFDYRTAIIPLYEHARDYCHSAERVLPFVQALGDNPEVISNLFKYATRTVVRVKVAEVSDGNVFIHVNENDFGVTLKRQAAVTISMARDGNDEEMVKFGVSYDKSYSQEALHTNEHFTQGCIWAALIKERMETIDTLRQKTLSHVKIDFRACQEFDYRPQETERLTRSFFTSSEITNGGSVEIGVTTHFLSLLTTAEDGVTVVASEQSDFEVLHYRTFTADT
eukprot:GHVS01072720.1.p1 GENE.GHVS01072720.1~~GHVS01072720.1.p1  ORF type:complete len:387 (+),score=21.60 GHVS01072720.1:103-1263(+)